MLKFRPPRAGKGWEQGSYGTPFLLLRFSSTSEESPPEEKARATKINWKCLTIHSVMRNCAPSTLCMLQMPFSGIEESAEPFVARRTKTGPNSEVFD